MSQENSQDNKAECVTRQHSEQNVVIKSMTEDATIKKNCIFKNRTDQDVPDDDSDNQDDVGAKIQNEKCIVFCLDRYSPSRQIAFEEKHRRIIIDALLKIQLSSKKNIRRLSQSQLLIRDKNNFINKFQNIQNCVDKCLEQIIQTCAGELDYPILYLRIYQLEARYNVYLQDHIDISTTYKNNRGFAQTLIKWVCFFCY